MIFNHRSAPRVAKMKESFTGKIQRTDLHDTLKEDLAQQWETYETSASIPHMKMKATVFSKFYP